MDWRDHITVDPGICHGRACISRARSGDDGAGQSGGQHGRRRDREELSDGFPRGGACGALLCRRPGQRTGRRVPVTGRPACASGRTRTCPSAWRTCFRAGRHEAATALDRNLRGERASDPASAGTRTPGALADLVEPPGVLTAGAVDMEERRERRPRSRPPPSTGVSGGPANGPDVGVPARTVRTVGGDRDPVAIHGVGRRTIGAGDAVRISGSIQFAANRAIILRSGPRRESCRNAWLGREPFEAGAGPGVPCPACPMKKE